MAETTNEPSPWVEVPDDKVLESGWYPVVTCWDVQEGMFPTAAYHDGKQWVKETRVVLYYPVLFINEDAAKKWAEDHDPEF